MALTSDARGLRGLNDVLRTLFCLPSVLVRFATTMLCKRVVPKTQSYVTSHLEIAKANGNLYFMLTCPQIDREDVNTDQA